ncbi:MAG TPA: DNA-3-methyladenine glycosylase I [Acidobacteriota bacterium]|nr:DNA-3-methyladenine glycosylase I [Acidobacteriota bacterium]
MEPKRCSWAKDPLSIQYHDTEWGVPSHEDNRLFEMIVLESMQSGLSWITILRKREAFRAAFSGFDPEKIAKFGAKEINKLLANPGIIRNRAKVEAAIANAQATLKVQKTFGSLDSFLWNTVDGKPVINHWQDASQIPAKTPISERLAKEFKAQGFKFMGPTVAYAFMQAVGMVNDHETSCDRHRRLAGG